MSSSEKNETDTSVIIEDEAESETISLIDPDTPTIAKIAAIPYFITCGIVFVVLSLFILLGALIYEVFHPANVGDGPRAQRK